ncbi:methyl-accepting chemotaxis protein [Geobacter sp. DSM 9736]|uniref:methyl-accepting chemotaxis protein n=1 Tax=Geobacter sp. DSM 9736 TaxID=1277350 RepID=UPI000B50748D|nr:methyl-accepting chemotaxis protein [Geobacter sp. DSM 9736]SNB46824.1 methyl-accepting chemotaxis protein [Geobacter sp. DSM 9736]
MQFFRNLSINAKLVLSFLAVLCLTIFLGMFAISRIGAISAITKDIDKEKLPVVQGLSKVNSLVGSYRRGELLLTLSQDEEGKQKYIKRNAEAAESMKKELAALDKSLVDGEEKRVHEEFKSAWAKYLAEAPKIAELALKNETEEAAALIRGESSKQFNAAIKAIEKNEELQFRHTQEQADSALQLSTSSRLWILGVLCGVVAAGLVLAFVIARLISAPIRDLSQKASAIAGGDLSIVVEQRSRDEVGELTGAFASMVQSLRSLISNVIETSQQVASSANQLQGTSTQLAVGAEEVVAQAGTVATASEEMAATAGEIAENCTRAAASSRQAEESANTGSTVIRAAIDGMERIAGQVKGAAGTVESLGARSEQIGAIIGTIEDIADQTNLLALNAAIEAARAGEQGRGFAVVADEVRALAERTTKATREIGEMIKSIQQETKLAVTAIDEGVREVARGSEDAAKSGQALREILQKIEEVSTQVSQIATAAEQQTATTHEITSNIHQINEVVQQSATGAQQSSGAAGELARCAGELQTMVRRFKLA